MFDFFLVVAAVFGVFLGVGAAANNQRLAKEQEELPTVEEYYLQRQAELHVEALRYMSGIVDCMIKAEKERLGLDSWFPEGEKPARPDHVSLVTSNDNDDSLNWWGAEEELHEGGPCASKQPGHLRLASRDGVRISSKTN